MFQSNFARALALNPTEVSFAHNTRLRYKLDAENKDIQFNVDKQVLVCTASFLSEYIIP